MVFSFDMDPLQTPPPSNFDICQKFFGFFFEGFPKPAWLSDGQSQFCISGVQKAAADSGGVGSVSQQRREDRPDRPDNHQGEL